MPSAPLRRRLPALLASLALTATAALHAPAALAQPAWPARPVTLVVTVPAGGSIDAVGRALAQDLGKALGQPVILDNRPGANGNIAAEMVRKAAPDGHTLLLMASSTFTLGPSLYEKLPFDPEKDFTPVATTAGLNMMLVVNPRLGTPDVKALVAKMKAQPDALNYGSSGNGSLSHIGGALLNIQTATRATHVAYKGIAPAMNDLLGGQLDFMFDSGTAMPHIHSGKLQALAVIGPKRMADFPNVPTFKEAGVPGMEAASGWHAVFAPAGTPPAVVARLNREINTILRKPETVQRLHTMGLESVTTTPEELGQALRQDLQRLGTLVKQAHIAIQ